MKRIICFLGLFMIVLTGFAPTVTARSDGSEVFSCNNVIGIPVLECEALVALYNSTNGPGWLYSQNWLVTNTPSNWDHVMLEGGHVAYLFLDGNLMTGSLPAELGNLTFLNQLTMSDNSLSGSIPDEVWNLPFLQYLMAGENQFTGSIPAGLATHSILQYLSLSNNQMSGSIPPDLGNLTTLMLLELDGNQFSGTIPPQLGNLTNLKFSLMLNDNQLGGSIPPELGNLTKLWILRLNDNHLTGDVPDTFINLTQLQNPGTAFDGGDGLDLDYNYLNVPPGYPDDAIPLQVFLYQKDPDWHLRQGILIDFFLPVIQR